eukprot:4589150-Pyramimonas_sp.AAC.1
MIRRRRRRRMRTPPRGRFVKIYNKHGIDEHLYACPWRGGARVEHVHLRGMRWRGSGGWGQADRKIPGRAMRGTKGTRSRRRAMMRMRMGMRRDGGSMAKTGRKLT